MASSGSTTARQPGIAGGDLLGLLGDVVVDDNHPGAGDSGAQSGDVVGTHHADTQNGYTQVGHYFS